MLDSSQELAALDWQFRKLTADRVMLSICCALALIPSMDSNAKNSAGCLRKSHNYLLLMRGKHRLTSYRGCRCRLMPLQVILILSYSHRGCRSYNIENFEFAATVATSVAHVSIKS